MITTADNGDVCGPNGLGFEVDVCGPNGRGLEVDVCGSNDRGFEVDVCGHNGRGLEARKQRTIHFFLRLIKPL